MHTTTYNDKIKPLMTEVEAICKENNIPMFFAICSNIDKEHSGEFITHVVSPASLGISLKNDNIADCFKVFNGYTPVYNEFKGMSFGDSIYAGIDEDSFTEEILLDEELTKKA